jgi:hypothetical protein
MSDLTLHLGYPKTGSTSLQRRVFRHLSEAAVPGRDDGILRPPYRWTASGPSARVGIGDVAALREWLTSTAGSTRLMSEESILGFSASRRRRPHRFRRWTPALNLVHALERLDIPRTQVHVVLTIRPQAELLPSASAESPPSGDLGRWVDEILRLPNDHPRRRAAHRRPRPRGEQHHRVAPAHRRHHPARHRRHRHDPPAHHHPRLTTPEPRPPAASSSGHPAHRELPAPSPAQPPSVPSTRSTTRRAEATTLTPPLPSSTNSGHSGAS